MNPPAAKPPFSVPRRCKATIDLAVCLEYLSAAPMPAHRERSFPGMFLIPRNRTIRPRAHGHARPLVPHSKAVAAPAKSGKGMPRRIFPDVRDFVEPPRQQWKTTTPDASVRECHNRLQYSFSRNSSRISSISCAYSLTEKVCLHCPQRNSTPRQVCTACNDAPQVRQGIVVCALRADRAPRPENIVYMAYPQSICERVHRQPLRGEAAAVSRGRTARRKHKMYSRR